MKIIWQNLVESVTADSESSGFPAANLLNDHSKKRWKATSSSASADAEIQGGSNAIGLYNIRADTVTIDIDGDSREFDLVRDDGFGEYRLQGIFWDYGKIDTSHTASISFSGSDDIACGIVFAGVAHSWTNPTWGMSTGMEGHSIIYDLDNGYEYIFQRNISLTPELQLNIKDRTEYFAFMHHAADVFPNPIMVQVEDFDDNLVYYARFNEIPKGQISKLGQYKISFSLKEFL